MRRGFTIGELLVTIGIVAIMAAVLFPVLTAAKQLDHRNVTASNLGRIAKGLHLYMEAYDSMTPSIDRTHNWTELLYPYVGSAKFYMNPDRQDFDSGCLELTKKHQPNPHPLDEPGCRYVGFGYNWGPIKRRGGGLLQPEKLIQTYPNHGVFPENRPVQIGIRSSEVVSPSETFSFSVTYDTPRTSMGIMFLLCTFTGKHNRDLFYNGNWPVGFLDGHVKTIPWVSGFGDNAAENRRFAIPANFEDITHFCANPDYVLGNRKGPGDQPDGEDDFIPPTAKCSDLPQLFRSLPTGQFDAATNVRTLLPR